MLYLADEVAEKERILTRMRKLELTRYDNKDQDITIEIVPEGEKIKVQKYKKTAEEKKAEAAARRARRKAAKKKA